MPESSNSSSNMQQRIAGLVQSATRRFVIAQREPWNLPENPVELPGAGDLPGQPPQINMLTMILPSAIMVVSTIVVAATGGKLTAIIPMSLMSLGIPMANLIGHSSQVKKYKQNLESRERNYRSALKMNARRFMV